VPFVLRSGRRSRWERNANIEESLKDLRPDACYKLSVWHIEDDHSNLNRVICALAAGREEIVNFDYLLIDYHILSDLNMIIESRPGVSADDYANVAWHRNLCDLTETKLRALAQTVRAHCQPVRIAQKDIALWLTDGVIAGHIDRQRMRLKTSALMKLDKIIQNRRDKT
jgi:hypothetical protein